MYFDPGLASVVVAEDDDADCPVYIGVGCTGLLFMSEAVRGLRGGVS